MQYIYLNTLGKPVKCSKPQRVCAEGFHVKNELGVILIVRPDNLFKQVNFKKKFRKSENKKHI